MKKYILISSIIFIITTTIIGCGREKEETPGFSSTWSSSKGPGPLRNTPMTSEEANHIMNNIISFFNKEVSKNHNLLLEKTYHGSDILGINILDKEGTLEFVYDDTIYTKTEVLLSKDNEVSANIIMKLSLDSFNKDTGYLKFQGTLGDLLYSYIRGDGKTLETYNKIMTKSLLRNIEDDNKEKSKLKAVVDNTNLEIITEVTNDTILIEIKIIRSIK